MTDSSDAPEPGESHFVAGKRVRHLSRSEQVALGRAERDRLPRSLLGRFEPASGRMDPVTLLELQSAARVPDLVPIRYGRMLVSPFTFYRGAAGLMAADLGAGERTTLKSQLCGDAHLSNFGLFATPERHLVFDLNDFDETLAGPFEWDVKRLVTSFVVAGRSLDWPVQLRRRVAVLAAETYRLWMARYAAQGVLDTWYARIDVQDLVSLVPTRAQYIEELARQAARRDSLGALEKLTEVVDGKRRFREAPPLLTRLDDPAVEEVVREVFRAYRSTLSPDKRELLARYRFIDLARKVVGVGSVGTRCWVIYLEGRDESDPLILQVKEANASVLEAWLGHPPEKHHGQRVVRGQRLMQASSDLFLGWVTGPGGPHYYWRQLWDAKLSVDPERFKKPGLMAYARATGWALARAHARSGNPVAISAYIGSGSRFDRAMLEFAEAYADQNERDYAALAAAAAEGRISVVTGV